jgi:hypothetical protein
MPPRMSAREREVLVVGRSYAPAVLGWCSTMRSSLPWYPRSSSATLGTADCWACTQSCGLLYSRAILMPNVAASPQKPVMYLSAREKRGYVKGRGKLPDATGCHAIPQNDGTPLSFWEQA